MDENKYKAATQEQMDHIYKHWDEFIDSFRNHPLFIEGQPELSMMITGRIKLKRMR